MIMLTTFFAALALLFKALLATLGILMAVMLFLAFFIVLTASAIGGLFQTEF